MTKVSEVRSALRRLALTKAADTYEDIVNGYANAYNRKGSITAPGVRASANANLRAQGYRPGRPSAPVPVAQPNAAADAALRKAQDADVARIRAALAGKAKAVARPIVNAVRPAISSARGFFK